MSKTRQIKCPVCQEYLEIDDSLRKGDIVYCSDCEEELKIVRVDPLKLKSMVDILEVYKEACKVVKGDGLDDNYAGDDEEEIEDRFSRFFEGMYGEDFE